MYFVFYNYLCPLLDCCFLAECDQTCACARGDTLNFETMINIFTVWKQFMKRNSSVYLKNRALEDPSFVFLISVLINLLRGQQNVI